MAFKYNMGSNAWSGWERQVLAAGGWPDTEGNREFLDVWNQFEHSPAKNNPLNLTYPDGVATINQAGVQSYASEQLGATYTAQNLKNFSTIDKLLASGDALSPTLLNSKTGNLRDALAAEIDHWTYGGNSDQKSNYGNWIRSLNLLRNPNTGSDIPARSPAASAGNTLSKIPNPFKDFESMIAWIGGNWTRILFFLGGALAIIFGGYMAFRSQTNKQTINIEGKS